MEEPFGWRNRCSVQDDSIRGFPPNTEAHVLRHDRNSPPFCHNPQSTEKRKKQTTLVVIKLLPFMFWSITLLPPTESSCQESLYKGMHSITWPLFLFKVYIALNYWESNNQHAHVIRSPDSIKINLRLVPLFLWVLTQLWTFRFDVSFCIYEDNGVLWKYMLYSIVIVRSLCVVWVLLHLLYIDVDPDEQ